MGWEGLTDAQVIHKLGRVNMSDRLTDAEIDDRRRRSGNTWAETTTSRSPTLHTLLCFVEDVDFNAAQKERIFTKYVAAIRTGEQPQFVELFDTCDRAAFETWVAKYCLFPKQRTRRTTTRRARLSER